MLKQSCISVKNPPWFWMLALFVYFQIGFANILLKFFISMSMSYIINIYFYFWCQYNGELLIRLENFFISFIFSKSLSRIDTFPSYKVGLNLLVKPSGPGEFFVEIFLITNSFLKVYIYSNIIFFTTKFFLLF